MFIEDGDQLAEYLRDIAEFVEGLPSERLVVESSLSVPAALFDEDVSFGDLSLPLDKNTYWDIRIKVKP